MGEGEPRTLNDLEEESRAVEDGLCKDLEQDALIVAIGKDPKLAALSDLLLRECVRAETDTREGGNPSGVVVVRQAAVEERGEGKHERKCDVPDQT